MQWRFEMSKATKSIRKALVASTVSAGLLAVGSLHGAQASVPRGPFNCELGPTALPDDRWSSCAFLSPDYCALGPTAVPDDRWAHCATN
jgi:hypothetical protein